MKRLLAALALASAAAIAVPAAAQDRIVIGVAVPLGGPIAPLGQQIEQGVRAAANYFNEAGTLGDVSLAVELVDDGCAEARGAAVANQLAGAGVALVVGHPCSAASVAAAAVYAAEGVILIAPASPDPKLTESRAGPGIFRLFGRSDRQASVLADAVASLPDQPVALIDDRSAYGRTLATQLREALTAVGRPPALSEGYFQSEFDPDGIASRLRAAGIGIVVVAAESQEAARVWTSLVSAGLDVVFVTGDVAADPGFAVAAGDAADGILFSYPTRPVPSDLALAVLGDAPSLFALNGFAAVEIWVAAAQEAASTGFAAVADAIAAGTFETAIGTVRFDPSGQADMPGWSVYRWSGGTFAPYP